MLEVDLTPADIAYLEALDATARANGAFQRTDPITRTALRQAARIVELETQVEDQWKQIDAEANQRRLRYVLLCIAASLGFAVCGAIWAAQG